MSTSSPKVENGNNAAVDTYDAYRKVVLSGTPEPEGRKILFTGILEALGMSASELAGRLGVAPITVHRWANGIAPRAALLKSLGEICRGGASTHHWGSVLGSNKPVPFGEAAAGLWDIQNFFDRARFAKRIYVFKTSIPFHAASSTILQEKILELLAGDQTREIHYFYPPGQDAAESFELLRDMLLYRERSEGNRIFGYDLQDSIQTSGDPMLNSLLTPFTRYLSPFILELNKEEVKTRGRLVDVLLEVPVQSYEPSGEITDFEKSRPRVWVEFPHFLAHKIWLEVRAGLYKATDIKCDSKGNPDPPLEQQLEDSKYKVRHSIAHQEIN